MTGLSRGASELLQRLTPRQVVTDKRLSMAARCLIVYLSTAECTTVEAMASDLGLTARRVFQLRAEIRALYPEENFSVPEVHAEIPCVAVKEISGSPYKERAPAPVSHQNERSKNLSDDDKTPEVVFRERIAARHPGTDVEHCLRSVKRYLGSIELCEFLAYDEKRTMSPHLLRNPTGHYVALAKAVARQDRDRLLIAVLTPRKPMEVERCSCRGGRLEEGYCGCSMGKDLERVEKRARQA